MLLFYRGVVYKGEESKVVEGIDAYHEALDEGWADQPGGSPEDSHRFDETERWAYAADPSRSPVQNRMHEEELQSLRTSLDNAQVNLKMEKETCERLRAKLRTVEKAHENLRATVKHLQDELVMAKVREKAAKK